MLKHQIDFFHENGFLVVNDIFTEDDADYCNSLIRRHANIDFAAIVNPDRYEDLITQDERPKSNITLEEIEETCNYFLSAMKNFKLVSALESLSGKEMTGLSSQFIFKEAYSKYASQAWSIHQDGWYPGDKHGDYVTANWFLRDTDVKNGTIFVYPGSHKLGLLHAQPQKSFREDYDKNPGSNCTLPDDFKTEKVDLEISKSSVVFLHGHCVHGSYPNTSERSRPWHSFCYITKGSNFVIGQNAKRREINLR